METEATEAAAAETTVVEQTNAMTEASDSLSSSPSASSPVSPVAGEPSPERNEGEFGDDEEGESGGTTATAAETEKKNQAIEEIRCKIADKEQHLERIKGKMQELRKNPTSTSSTELRQMQTELEEQATLITALQINLVTMEERQRTRALRGYLLLRITRPHGTSFKKFYCVAEYPFFRYYATAEVRLPPSSFFLFLPLPSRVGRGPFFEIAWRHRAARRHEAAFLTFDLPSQCALEVGKISLSLIKSVSIQPDNKIEFVITHEEDGKLGELSLPFCLLFQHSTTQHSTGELTCDCVLSSAVTQVVRATDESTVSSWTKLIRLLCSKRNSKGLSAAEVDFTARKQKRRSVSYLPNAVPSASSSSSPSSYFTEEQRMR